MKPHKPAIRSTTLAGVLGVCLSTGLSMGLLIPASAPAARDRAITGKLDRGGLTVIALTPGGAVSRARAKPRFRVVPRAPAVTLHLLDRAGAYLGPVVVAGRDGRVTLGVRAGAKLGRIDVKKGYARVSSSAAPHAVDERLTARARGGKPIGAGTLGLVPGRAHRRGAPGTDPDRDGIPNKFDVDDDGDLVLDARERPPEGLAGAKAASGERADETDSDRADAALVVAIAAAALAAASLCWQLVALLRRRRRRVEVDVRLGLPIYPQGGGDWSVFVEVRNGTDHPLRWVAAALELADGRRLYLMHQPPGGELPAVLQPHDSHQTWAPCRILEQGGLELTERVVGTAKLDSGEVVRSPRRRLVSRSARKRRRD